MEKQETQRLKRSLGFWSAVAINVGAIIGGGIFVVTGIVAGYAGSSLFISMIFAGFIAFITAWSFARLTTWQPVEGGAYEYGRQLVSPFVGFLAGWMWLVANTFTGATVSLGFAYYLTSVFPILPSNIVAAFTCLSFMGLNLIGAKQSANVNNFLVVLKLAVLTFFVIFGLLHLNIDNFLPFEPLSSGVFYGTFFIFFGYGGFARVSVIAEEIKDAKRNVPRALLVSLVISMIVYVLVGLVAIGLLGPMGLSESNTPLSTAVAVTGNSFAVQFVSFGGLVATTSVLLTAIFGVSRMAFAMARRKDLPAVLAKVHPKFGVPYYSILLSGSLMAILVLFVDLTRVVAIGTFALVLNYSITNIAGFRLNSPKIVNKIIPVVGFLTCILLLIFLLFASPDSWLMGSVFLIVGTLYYLLKIKFRHSKNK